MFEDAIDKLDKLYNNRKGAQVLEGLIWEQKFGGKKKLLDLATA